MRSQGKIWIKFIISYTQAWCSSFFHQSIHRNQGVVHYLSISRCTCICIYIGISHSYTHTYKHACATHAHMYTRACAHTHTHTHTHWFISSFILYTHFQLKSLISALYHSGDGQTKHFFKEGSFLGWKTLVQLWERERSRAENVQMSVIPLMKASYIYRDSWTRLSVTPAKILQVHVHVHTYTHVHVHAQAYNYYNTCTCTLLCDVQLEYECHVVHKWYDWVTCLWIHVHCHAARKGDCRANNSHSVGTAVRDFQRMILQLWST